MSSIPKKTNQNCACDSVLFCDVCKNLDFSGKGVVLNACNQNDINHNWELLRTTFNALKSFCNVKMPEEVIIYEATSKGELPITINYSNPNGIAKILIYKNATKVGIYYWLGNEWNLFPIPEICLSDEKKVITGFTCIHIKLINENCSFFDPNGIDFSQLTPCDIEVLQNGVEIGDKGNAAILGFGSTVKYSIDSSINKIYFWKAEDESIAESIGTIDNPCWIKIKVPIYETTQNMLSCGSMSGC